MDADSDESVKAVFGGAATLVLGMIAAALGGLALTRRRRTALEPGQRT